MTRNHESFLKINRLYEDANSWYLVMDFYEDGTLQDLIERGVALQELDVAQVMMQLCAGLAHMHSLGIVHCDIKPTNILVHLPVQQSRLIKIVISDFGVSHVLKPNMRSHNLKGTPCYIAPEVFSKNGYN